uniref:HAP1 N-terminal domain-containing protein n=1 Tax=Heterorhabditis bacteriophora TaxID=37862 RepID=A0A1I7XM70_HETBA
MTTAVANDLRVELATTNSLTKERCSCWSELVQYRLARNDNFTDGIITEQIDDQSKELQDRYTHLVSLSDIFDGLLFSSAALFKTADSGISLLCDAVNDGLHQFSTFKKKIGTIEQEARATSENIADCVKKHADSLADVPNRISQFEESRSGWANICALLSELKINEEKELHVVKSGTNEGTRLIKQKSNIAEELEIKVTTEEEGVQLMISELCTERDNTNVLSEQLAHEQSKIKKYEDQINKYNTDIPMEENSEAEKNKYIAVIDAELISIEQELENIAHSEEEVENSLSDEKRAIEAESWSSSIMQEREKYSSIERSLEEGLSLVRRDAKRKSCKLELLKEQQQQLDPDKGDWTPEQWEQAIHEQYVAQSKFDEEVSELERSVTDLENALSNNDKEANSAQNLTSLERELITDLERLHASHKSINDNYTDIKMSLESARNNLRILTQKISELDSQLLITRSDTDMLLAQIAAFTSMYTPVKEVRPTIVEPTPVASDSEGELLSSTIPHVEGLQPFSPATMNMKNRMNERIILPMHTEKMRTHCKLFEDSMEMCDTSLESDEGSLFGGFLNIPINQNSDNTVSNDERNNAVEKDRSFDGSSGRGTSESFDTLAETRFPSDIFLKDSPSFGRTSSSPRSVVVSALRSPVVPPAFADDLDDTADTDPDQSIWDGM